MLIDSIKSVYDLRRLKIERLTELSDDVRECIIDTVSKNGGHLASSLGVVELTIALHYVFNTPVDRIIWDVGHQSYAHKILTGRRSAFHTLRQYGGLSGFPKIEESEFDSYNTGHSSTSLSLALGEAVVRDLKRSSYKVLPVIGDGSLTGGMAFEALNQIGHLKKEMIIILNDNEHSISKNVGALSDYLIRLITGSFYNKMRKRSYDIIKKIPRYGDRLYDFVYRQEARLKGFFIPGAFFEELGIRYFGPVDGHNLPLLIDVLRGVKEINLGPKLVHVITKKGKGYEPAEKEPARFHGIGPFDRRLGIPLKSKDRDNGKLISYSEIAGRTLAEIAKTDKKIIAITAAMKLGTGLHEFERHAPRRFFDVGIAEQHAFTFASALAVNGFRPFVSVYSTFLQRAIDQIIHDIAIMKAPVRILIDRAGIVGEDGETHHGVFDISLLKNVPNMVLLAPSSGAELRDMIYFAARYDRGPVAIRYPRGSGSMENLSLHTHNAFSPGKIRRLSSGKDIALLAAGDMVAVASEIARILRASGIDATVADIQSIKPLDVKNMEKIIAETEMFITLENGIVTGGFGEYLLSSISRNLRSKQLMAAGFPDSFVPHGTNPQLLAHCGIDADCLAKTISDTLQRSRRHEKRHTAGRLSG